MKVVEVFGAENKEKETKENKGGVYYNYISDFLEITGMKKKTLYYMREKTVKGPIKIGGAGNMDLYMIDDNGLYYIDNKLDKIYSYGVMGKIICGLYIPCIYEDNKYDIDDSWELYYSDIEGEDIYSKYIMFYNI